MTRFEKVKDNVTVVDAATRYGLTVSRNGMTRCPFHNDHTPSLKLNEKYFFCFGCGANGDVIDLTVQLFDLTPHGAVQKLASDFGIDDNELTIKTSAETQPFRDKERLCFSALADYLRLLRERKAKYAPATQEDTIDDRFAEACHKEAHIEYLMDIFISGSREERQQTVDELLAAGRIHPYRQEGVYHERA